MNDRLLRLLKRGDVRLHRLARAVPALTWLLRLVSFSIYRALELAFGQAHPHVRTERQARRLRSRQDAGPGGQRVLFFTVRGWYAHVTTELVLATALAQRDATTHFFICGGTTPQCDFKPATDPAVTAPLCWRCRGFARRTLQEAGHAPTELSDLVTATEIEAHADAVSRLDFDGLQSHVYADHPVGQYVLPSVQRSLLRGDITGDRWSLDVLRGFVVTARVMVDAAERLYDVFEPDVVVMTNGSFAAERCALEVARRRGIRVVSYERGMRKDTVVLGHDAPVIPFETDELWAQAPKQLTADEREEVGQYLELRASGEVGVQQLWPQIEDDGRAIFARIGIDPERPTAVLFTNVVWDSAVFRRDVGFDGMADWVIASIRAFADRPDRQLVVRVHPAEIRIPMSESRDRVLDRIAEAIPVMPPNVVVVPPSDPASSYALLEAADVVLTYTSTTGLEAACRGKRVVVSGRTHYAGHGFTHEAGKPTYFGRAIDAAFDAGPLTPRERDLAWAYAHLFFCRFVRPFPWVDDRSRSTRGFRIESSEVLAPGRDPDMDHICDVILSRGDVLLPRRAT